MKLLARNGERTGAKRLAQLPIRQLALVLACTIAALALPDPVFAAESATRPTLFRADSTQCRENFAEELRRSGLDVVERPVAQLKGLATLLELPRNSNPRHVLLVEGYAVVDHVAPDEIRRLLQDRPKVSGVIGTSACPNVDNHDLIHRGTVVRFGATR